jgi:hypothetical protein
MLTSDGDTNMALLVSLWLKVFITRFVIRVGAAAGAAYSVNTRSFAQPAAAWNITCLPDDFAEGV